MKNLVLVESPAKTKTISKFLGKDFTVMASMGHVRDLPKSTLGFDPEDNFKPNYQISTDKKKVIADLKKQITKDTTIYLAADEDREGEAIAWHLIPASAARYIVVSFVICFFKSAITFFLSVLI